MQDAIKRALCVYSEKGKMEKLIITAMKQDFSWAKSAKKYIELYERGIRKRNP
jgi:starch synthase